MAHALDTIHDSSRIRSKNVIYIEMQYSHLLQSETSVNHATGPAVQPAMNRQNKVLRPAKGIFVVTVATTLALAPLTEANASPYQNALPALTDMGAEVNADEAEPEGPAEASSQPEPKKGLGMMISGGVITGLYALPLSLWGIVIIAGSKKAANETGSDGVGKVGGALGGVILGFGLVGLAVGVPLLGVGGSRFSKWRKWKEANKVALAPNVGRTAFGTYTPGLALRF